MGTLIPCLLIRAQAFLAIQIMLPVIQPAACMRNFAEVIDEETVEVLAQGGDCGSGARGQAIC